MDFAIDACGTGYRLGGGDGDRLSRVLVLTNHSIYFPCHVLRGKNATVFVARKNNRHVWVQCEAKNLTVVEFFAGSLAEGAESHDTLGLQR